MLKPGQSITITQSSVSLEQLLGKFIFSVTDMVERDEERNHGHTGSGTHRAPPGAGAEMIAAAPAIWPQPDGTPVACREKLRMLAENHAELAQVMQDAFEDAVLMGVDEAAMRRILAAMVEQLRSPKQAAG